MPLIFGLLCTECCIVLSCSDFGLTVGHASAQLPRQLVLPDIWCQSVQLQWKDELVLVKDGKVEHVVSRAGSRGLLPEIHSVTPACVSSTQMEDVKVTGSNIAGHGQTVLCRSQGTALHYTACAVIHTLTGSDCGSGSDAQCYCFCKCTPVGVSCLLHVYTGSTCLSSFTSGASSIVFRLIGQKGASPTNRATNNISYCFDTLLVRF